MYQAPDVRYSASGRVLRKRPVKPEVKYRQQLYSVWVGMNQRCYNKRHTTYKTHGGRGIKVCNSWRLSFPRFLKDMARTYRPGLQLDRTDNDKGYSRKNCKWVTPVQNTRNRSVTTMVRCPKNGEYKSLAEVCEDHGIEVMKDGQVTPRYRTVHKRVCYLKWPVWEAIEVPTGGVRTSVGR